MAGASLQLGFLGLGVMGGRMVARLLDAGHVVVAYDVRPEALDAALARGARAAASPEDVAMHTDIVFLSLGRPGDVEVALTGAGGVIHGARAKIVVDCSTTGSVMERRMAAALAGKGKVLLDAPVSGGPSGAETGTLAVMVSGREAEFWQAKPALDVIGRVFYLGPESGAGQCMKLANNMVGAACGIASLEALVFGAKAGLDPKQMCEVMSAGSASNFSITTRIPKSVLSRNFPNLFATELLYKDVSLGAEEAAALGVPLKVIEAVKDFLAFAVAQGDGPVDWANSVKHLERAAGVIVAARTK